MAEKKFDEYQQDAINVRKNSVISAGAGSGKTTVLAERFSSLVLDPKEKIGVDQVLTLTFTKKATVEMSARIYKVLKKHNPKKAADFYKANIKTLDSYCNSVAKMGCHYYGISPDFVQDDGQINSAVYAMALPFILEHRDNEAIKALVSAGNFDSIASELFVNPILSSSTIAEPIDFDKMLHKQVEEIVSRWKTSVDAIHKSIVELEHRFNNMSNANTGTDAYAAYNSFFGPDATETIPEKLLLSVKDVESCKIKEATEYAIAIKKIASLPKTGRLSGLKELSPVINSLKDELYPEFAGIFNFVYGYELTKKILPLLKDFQDKVNAYKRSSGILSFKDISNMAKCVLRDYPEIRQIEKERYKYIMIDEFQDNNKDQRDMLFMLAEKLSRKEKGVPEVNELEKEKLFFVGDEKQSIYRFRGADVSVFNALSEDFKEGNLNMSTNYRSDSALIKGFNTIFGGYEYPLPAAPKENPEENSTDETETEIPSAFFSSNKNYSSEIPKYEAIYKEVLLPKSKEEEASDIAKYKEIYAPHIHFALYDKTQDAAVGTPSMEEAEAQWIAEKINELTTKGINGKVYSHSDIAILMRTYTLQPLYERTFLKNGIPYNTEVVTGFFADGPVNDIFSILRLCAYPDDTAAYAQVLMSPWVNLSFEQANEIIFAKKIREAPFSQDVSKILPEDALKRYCHAKDFFKELNESAKTAPLTKTITKLWYSSGYRYETMWNKTVSMYGKLYDLIFELARKSEDEKMTLGAFVDSVRTYRDQSEKLDDMDIPFEQTKGVHILSIHKSKGLEYSVVFVIGTHKLGRRENNSRAVYISKKNGITLNTKGHPEIGGTNPFYIEAHNENRAQAAAELRRLTYVALTRAKEHLFLTNGKYAFNGNHANMIPGKGGIPESIFNILEPVYNHYFYNRDEETTISGPFSRAFIKSSELGRGQMDSNSHKAKVELLKKISSDEVYGNALTIEKEEPLQLYARPSQLHEADDETYRDGSFVTAENAVANAFKEYDRINEIIVSTVPVYQDKEKQPAFSHANFGTIAHAYLESRITGHEPVISNRDILGLENKEKAIEEIKEICTLMAERFQNSDLGKKAFSSKWHKAEYNFRSRITLKDKSSKIIKGSIDLVFENGDGTYTIVDYKTNQELKPEIYYDQLACYRQAVSQMLNVTPDKVRTSLYYLRFDKEVDVTEETAKVDLASAILRIDEQ
ncbi:UvrD-helicase domain-containing protein [Treponema sp.]|uniref:UvrD-helicase domain-containing protein n=1 Tax=Treponema sp. TaxID=166 RepID=UPI00298DA056|nr:UvrD-helicase domain-containing protein [Treponema sp.]MCQ2240713.1 UvrD-helicase domain-containing protein [Treponema sp.]